MCRNQVFLICANTSISKQSFKNAEHPFVEIGKWFMHRSFIKRYTSDISSDNEGQRVTMSGTTTDND